ncbi:MAG: hypothetical protein HY553_06600, partial [Elusimicrobia bacterium]|nr:hypothetical protein [Elusimicrobiota bacterium]
MSEPKLLPAGEAKAPKPRKRLEPALVAACVAAACIPVFVLAWILGAPPKPAEPTKRLALAPPPQMPAPKPQPRRVAAPPAERARAVTAAAKPAVKTAAAGLEAVDPEEEEPATEVALPEDSGLQAPPENADAPAAAGFRVAGALQAIAPFGSQGGGGGGGGANAAGVGPQQGLGPAGASAGGGTSAREDAGGVRARLARGFTAIGRALGVRGGPGGGGGVGQAFGGGRGGQGGGGFGSTNAPAFTAQPGGGIGINGPGAAGVGGAGAGQAPGPYQGPGGGAAGNPDGGDFGVPPQPEGGGGLITRGEAGEFEGRLALQSQLVRRTVTKPVVDVLEKVMKKYATQVERAAKAVEKMPDLTDAIAFFSAHADRPGYAEIRDDLTTFQWFLVSDREKAPPAAVQAQLAQRPEGTGLEDWGLKARLLDTRELIASMGTCLADFKGAFPKSDAGKTTKKKAAPKPNQDLVAYRMGGPEIECTDKAARALRRRAQPGLGFIPVARGAMLALNGTADGKGKKKLGLQARYAELKKLEKTDPVAKEAAQKLLKALKAGNSAVKGVLNAFKQPPFKPGPKDDKPRDAAEARAGEVQALADELAARQLPPGADSATLPIKLANVVLNLRATSLGLA